MDPIRPVPGLADALRVGQRVYLRHARPSDRRALARLRQASEAFLAPWEPKSMRDPASPEGFDLLLRANEDPRYEKMFVCRVSDGELLGAVNLNEILKGPAMSCFLGYWIGLPYARQGFMTEALELALARAFLDLKLHRVEANIMPHNTPSLRLVRRAGFRREGCSLKYLEIAGRWEDHDRWALLAEEWAAR
jgi:ribosomal-protein-alanine N-acetyltransferase